MPLKQEVQQPVVPIRRSGQGEVEKETAHAASLAKDLHLGGKFIFANQDFLHAILQVTLERLPPFARWVIPEDKSMALEAVDQALVDAFFRHGLIISC